MKQNKNFNLLHLTLLGLFIFTNCRQSQEQKINDSTITKLQTPKMDTLNFDEQLKVFESLGYKLNVGISKEVILSEIQKQDLTIKDAENIFKESKFERLYYYLGWLYVDSSRNYYTDNCIWFDLEFIDPSSEYITFMERMGVITNGELSYTEISIRVDENNYEWIDFKVNGISKKWKLAKVRYIDDSFFQRFSYLPQEFKTKGRYTYYDDGGQQFVIDYATEDEQKQFIEKTGLKREWLGIGNHFSEHDPKK